MKGRLNMLKMWQVYDGGKRHWVIHPGDEKAAILFALKEFDLDADSETVADARAKEVEGSEEITVTDFGNEEEVTKTVSEWIEHCRDRENPEKPFFLASSAYT